MEKKKQEPPAVGSFWYVITSIPLMLFNWYLLFCIIQQSTVIAGIHHITWREYIIATLFLNLLYAQHYMEVRTLIADRLPDLERRNGYDLIIQFTYMFTLIGIFTCIMLYRLYHGLTT